jgi:catechol 2,3-dioxygenase-like lactoylglutathione lyase family enzyme
MYAVEYSQTNREYRPQEVNMSDQTTIKMRYIGEAAPNFDEAVSFYEQAWGLKKVEHDSDIAFFAAESNPEQYILRLRRDPEKRLDVIGFGVETAAEVDALAAELASAGVRFAGEPGSLRTPGGGNGFRVFDPDGRVVEISSDVEQRQTRQLEYRESIPVGISHIVLSTPQVAETCHFYKSLIGFEPRCLHRKGRGRVHARHRRVMKFGGVLR